MKNNNLPTVLHERGVDATQYNVLKNMIFPGSKDDNVLAVALDYCKARKLDIMKKPCHIVPVWDGDKNKFVETVWPSIYEYRTTASRTGLYAGKDAPEFGEDVTKEFGNQQRKKSYTFPKWCKVTVYKIVSGQRCAFEGKVFWEECVVLLNKTGQPNKMWSKRTNSQLAKCAEAEALRAAFPDELGGLVTAEEMDGRDIAQSEPKQKEPQDDAAKKFKDRVAKESEPKDVTPKAEEQKAKPEDSGAKVTDIEPEELDENEPKEWDGKTLSVGGKLQELNFNDATSAANYLKGVIKKRKRKQSRIDLINENLPLIKALAKDGKSTVVGELHKLADEGTNA